MKINFLAPHILSILIINNIGASQSQCTRVPHEEGWLWVENIAQIEIDASVGIELQSVHDQMHVKRKRLQENLPIPELMIDEGTDKARPKKNILLVEMSLILKPKNPQARGSVFFSTDVFSEYVFISGEIEELKATCNRENSSVTWQEVKKNDPFRHICRVFEREIDYVAGTKERVCLIHTENKQGAADPFSREQSILKTVRLYKGVSEECVPTKVRLARMFFNMMKQGEWERSKNLETWYAEASKPKMSHASQSIHAPNPQYTDENFFDGNKDSEQKFLCFINDLVDCLDLYTRLGMVIRSMQEYITSHQVYRGGEIYESVIDGQYDSGIHGALKEIREGLEKTFEKKASEKGKKLVEELEMMFKEKAHQNRKDLTKLNKTPKHIDDNFFIESIEKLSQDTRVKNASELDSINLTTLREFISKVLSIAGQLRDPENLTYSELKVFYNELERINNRGFFKIHESIESLKTTVINALKKYEEHVVDKIVFNFHNTYDCCANCAPDLCQELHAEAWGNKGRFVEYLSNLIRELNCDQSKPTFMLIISCADERLDKWCSKCRTSQKVTTSKSPNSCYQYSYQGKEPSLLKQSIEIVEPYNQD